MKKFDSVLLGTLLSTCVIGGIKADNNENVASFGNISYAAYKYFDIVFDEKDLKAGNFLNNDSLIIPLGVTKVDLILPSHVIQVNMPETVRTINRDIFKQCNLQHLIISSGTTALICKASMTEDAEVGLRKYFGLREDCNITIGGKNLTGRYNDVESSVNVVKKNDFLTEINNFDKNKLKKSNVRKNSNVEKPSGRAALMDEIKTFEQGNQLRHVNNEALKNQKNESSTPSFLDQIKSFESNRLRHVDIEQQRSQKSKDDDNTTVNALRKAMEERRQDLEYDDDDDDDYYDSWDD